LLQSRKYKRPVLIRCCRPLVRNRSQKYARTGNGLPVRAARHATLDGRATGIRRGD
jgi:hypothetical protein